MTTNEPESVAQLDWRINNVTWTTAPFENPATKVVVPAGSAVIQATLAEVRSIQIGISVPNAPALFLNLSKQLHDEAERAFQKAVDAKDVYGRLPDDFTFDYLEKIMASIVFGCTSLEALANELVPSAFVYEKVESQHTKRFDKGQIERSLSLKEKIGDVLPAALGVKSPKGGKLWSNFEHLEMLRHRIIHMKTSDRQCTSFDRNSIWNVLLSHPIPQTDAPAKAIIAFFLDRLSTRPRWFKKCPL